MRGGVRTINLSMGAGKHLRLHRLQVQIDWVPEHCGAGGDAPPVRYGARQFAAFRIIVLNEDNERRVELDPDRISCDCGRRKRLSAVPFRKLILPSRQIFAGNIIFPRNSYKGIVLFDGTCGARDTRLVTIRLGNVTFHYLF
jgi:hypothetical protein